jgi:hypothetical protein
MKDKQKYQKRSLAVTRLAQYIEEFPDIPISKLLCMLVSPIGESKHPYYWDDNILIGKIEKNSDLIREEYQYNEYTD